MLPVGKEEEEEEEDILIGDIAKHFLNKPNTDKTFGVRKEGEHHYIGNKHVFITEDDDIIMKESGDRFLGTPSLWGLNYRKLCYLLVKKKRKKRKIY